MTRDLALLRRAFREAERAGWLTTAPNPRVGALALRDGHVIGYGHHQVFGGAHAEENALRDAGAWNETTGRMEPGHVDEIIVTLEPCSARSGGKKRTPCLEHLLQAGVKRVVVGATDPDARHQGKAFAAMEEQGIEVVHLEEDACFAAQNPAFLAALEHPKRPWTLLKWAASLDGYTATPDGTSQWITSEAARTEVHALRGCSHAVMAAKGTLQKDRPRLTARDAVQGLQRNTARILVDAFSSVQAGDPLLEDDVARYWIVDQEEAEAPSPSWWTDLDHRIAVPRGITGALVLEPGLEALRQEHGIQRILVEGGARLHGSLLQSSLADAILRYEAPLLMAGGHGSCVATGYATPQEGLHLIAEERADLGPDLRRAFLVQQPS
ncbi:MAG: bifunctional diaminohydroxyphosphoribosylaminopyrimidine deaminase/5-amino-6-(5-phosphoribosylamino)uracil reductase RibD [Planctomycetota bacterium]